MSKPDLNRHQSSVVLIVDDVMDNLAVLHDALDESGYTVLIANNGKVAIERAEAAQPEIILLDAMMPEMDGFEVCRKLKANAKTSHIPVIFMTGLTESEHVVAAFQAGGTDYVTKPIRTTEVIARIAAHLKTSRQVHQARGALDAFGQAAIAITPQNGKIVWQTPLARQWIQSYFFPDNEVSEFVTPSPVFNWIASAYQADASGKTLQAMTIIQSTKRLSFSPADISSDEQWVIVLREESDTAQIEALMLTFKLTKRESEVLYWAIKGKTSRDIGDILSSSPRTINKHLEHVFVKLGVETRTAAASLAASKLRGFN
ncbi:MULTISPECIES: response regulator transcription factor [Methylotenera]|uniref:response regulator transcription factor n=1 Tax=Methylotenera TaxID=359407 RepID=UPI00037125C8|nr:MULTISPECIES: response regulator transcription factor [Methylotenera]